MTVSPTANLQLRSAPAVRPLDHQRRHACTLQARRQVITARRVARDACVYWWPGALGWAKAASFSELRAAASTQGRWK